MLHRFAGDLTVVDDLVESRGADLGLFLRGVVEELLWHLGGSVAVDADAALAIVFGG